MLASPAVQASSSCPRTAYPTALAFLMEGRFTGLGTTSLAPAVVVVDLARCKQQRSSGRKPMRVGQLPVWQFELPHSSKAAAAWRAADASLLALHAIQGIITAILSGSRACSDAHLGESHGEHPKAIDPGACALGASWLPRKDSIEIGVGILLRLPTPVCAAAHGHWACLRLTSRTAAIYSDNLLKVCY